MKPHTTISTTGQPCPASGLWQSMGYFKTTVPVKAGRAMPDYCGIHVDWMLLVPDQQKKHNKMP